MFTFFVMESPVSLIWVFKIQIFEATFDVTIRVPEHLEDRFWKKEMKHLSSNPPTPSSREI